jgi:multiple sugar transport system permease protein
MSVSTAQSQTTEIPVEPQARAKPGRRPQTILAEVLGQIGKYLLLIVLAFSFVLPFYWMASSALKSDSMVYTIPPVWVPIPAAWNQLFWDAWTTYNFNLYAFNTIFRYAIPVTIAVTLSSAVVAYGFSRIRWPGRNVLFFVCLMTMMVPFQVTMVPLFIIFKKVGWIGTYNPLLAPALFGSPYFIFMLRQFFLTIPQELSEAARLDGANEFGILTRVVLPLAKPALAVVALFTFMNAWNDYLGPLIYLNREKLYTLSLGIADLRQSIDQVGSRSLAYPYLMAVSTIVTAPILILFFFAQRTFIEGISLTGLKG